MLGVVVLLGHGEEGVVDVDFLGYASGVEHCFVGGLESAVTDHVLLELPYEAFVVCLTLISLLFLLFLKHQSLHLILYELLVSLFPFYIISVVDVFFSVQQKKRWKFNLTLGALRFNSNSLARSFARGFLEDGKRWISFAFGCFRLAILKLKTRLHSFDLIEFEHPRIILFFQVQICQDT